MGALSKRQYVRLRKHLNLELHLIDVYRALAVVEEAFPAVHDANWGSFFPDWIVACQFLVSWLEMQGRYDSAKFPGDLFFV